MPKISVVIPVYNSEEYLRQCLDSIFCQTLQDFEIIIVNDGSPDNSQAIIDEYCSLYPEKIVAIKQANAGQAAARNRALEHISGEYLMFVDSDDYIEPGTFERTCNYADENGLDIVCFLWREIMEQGIRSHTWEFPHIPENPRYILNTPSPCNKIYKSSLFKNHNIRFAENYIYEDLAMIPTIALYTEKIGFIDDCLYNYVIHTGSTMTQQKYNKKLQSIYFAMDYLEEAFKDTKYTEELEYLYIEHLLHYATLRYLNYAEGKADIRRIADIMKQKYPEFYKNKYFKQMGIKVKIFCFLAFSKNIFILSLIFNRKEAVKCLIRKG
ncbi:MAG: glycosyltransferase [Clostridia bacterium]|nr:glycosyltransferase [Clostridia bacterium]